MLAVMCPVWGWIADRIGAANTLGIGAAGSSAVVYLFFQNIDAIAADPAQLSGAAGPDKKTPVPANYLNATESPWTVTISESSREEKLVVQTFGPKK